MIYADLNLAGPEVREDMKVRKAPNIISMSDLFHFNDSLNDDGNGAILFYIVNRPHG